MAMAGYCSTGLRPLPSGGLTMRPSFASSLNGLATKLLSVRKKTSMVVRMAITHGIMSRCRRRLVKATTAVYELSSHIQNSSEPSCPLHQAANL